METVREIRATKLLVNFEKWKYKFLETWSNVVQWTILEVRTYLVFFDDICVTQASVTTGRDVAVLRTSTLPSVLLYTNGRCCI